jgi:hypothetical protein
MSPPGPEVVTGGFESRADAHSVKCLDYDLAVAPRGRDADREGQQRQGEQCDAVSGRLALPDDDRARRDSAALRSPRYGCRA